jgi:class 3 adenylate cyclase/tetratricopeptide (TPR) repeat protein
MKCPECQFENRETAKFCGECGHRFEIACPECGFNNRAGNKFCDECGHDLRSTQETPPVNYSEPESYTPKFLADKILTTRSSIEGERKLVTVLFADVANYTAMSEKLDPEEVHQIMDGCFKILMDEIHRCEGTINQFTGDGVMALFGAPLAHEDHAQRACHAALSSQKTLEKYGQKVKQDHGLDFKMRIGLNSGPVVVASIGDDLRMDYTAVGDTTNLAARMESKAEPGRILLSEATHKLVKDFFEFNPLGKVEVKGKEQPQETYELLKISDIDTRISASVAKGLTKFVGRKNSMAALKEVFERVISGSGQVVGIVGEAGVGKSRLLFEFVKQLPLGETTYLEGRCLHFGSGMVYLPILDMVRAYFEIKEGDPESVIKEKLLKKIRQLDERLLDTLPSFQELLSVKVEDEKYMQLDPGHKKMQTFEAIRNLFIRVSERQPLVLAIEDLHWIDKTSEECISYLIDWLANTRIMLILLYRLEYTHQWGSKSYYTKIGLTQLGDLSSRLLVQAILKEEKVPPEIRYQVLSRAGGNPLFVEELTQSLLESGAIVRKGHQYMLTRDLSEIQVPDTIQGIIAARIDRIEESMKHVIQVAAVIGREFAFRILQSIVEMKKNLKSHLLNLQGLEFISQKRLFPELEYIFKHALTQEVAYNSLLQKRRKEIHEKTGIAIESLYPDRLEEYYELLAYHFRKSDNKDKALEYLDLANQKAIKANAVEEAKNYFEEAIKLIDILPETASNQRRIISMLVSQLPVMLLLLKFNEYYEYLTRYESIAIGLEDPGLLGAYYGRVGTCEWSFGNFKQALQTNSKASELCNIAKNPIEAGYAYMQLAWDHLYLGDFKQVLIFKDLTMRAMERQFNLRICSWALQAASWAYSYMGQWDQAVKEGEEALRIAEEFSDNSVASFAAWILCLAYTYKGDLSRALEYGEMAVQRAPTPADRAWAQGAYAFALGRAGEIDKPIEILANLVPVYRAANFVPGSPTMLWLVEGYIQAGEYHKASQTLDELMAIAKRCEMRFLLGSGYRFAGEISVKTNPEDSAGFFEKSIALLKEINAENELAMAYAGYGRLHKQQGNVFEAKEFLTRALEIFERLGTLIEPDRVREELAGLPEP